MTFHITTLGCKVNTYESEIMRELLENEGFVFTEKQNSDITIINTCSVTNMADKKSKKIVRQIKRNNPNTILIVAGCSSENQKEYYKTLDIDILLGNKDKSKIVLLIQEFLKSKNKIIDFYHTRNLPFEDMTINRFKSHTRAFLKIQDGC
ncbi:MAG: tRNA (N(6)-L-threonylcarbamoyladenosine(37)-C(2))-methylthiotransferase MtaB, partial [Bacilli bacterium]|nr:tRNA (N(6)-L-threonylcarbamoyladenosine(37)-C(2))-methylthiotransferase MtaB [Bacilli bacterium]